jgi:CRISPR-associated protein Cas1
MRKLVINDYGIFLGKKGDRIIVKKSKEKIGEISAGNVSQVIITSKGVSFSSDFLRLLLKYKIDLVILSDIGTPLGRLVSKERGGIQLRKNQYASQKDWHGLYLAKKFAEAKIYNQYALLKSFAKNRKNTKPEIAEKLISIANELKREILNIENINGANIFQVREKIMSYEANAADKYWYGIKILLEDKKIEFPGRKKRFDNPNDPINIMLNYGYGILASQIWMNVECSSLDPYAGFLHIDSSRRPALVMDLIEEFRQPIVDRAILKIAFEEGNNLYKIIENGKLTIEGRRKLLEKIFERLKAKVTFQNRVLPLEAHILLQVRRIAEFIMGRAKEYMPYVEKQ